MQPESCSLLCAVVDVLEAFVSLFRLATLSGFTNLVRMGVSSRSPDLAPGVCSARVHETSLEAVQLGAVCLVRVHCVCGVAPCMDGFWSVVVGA